MLYFLHRLSDQKHDKVAYNVLSLYIRALTLQFITIKVFVKFYGLNTVVFFSMLVNRNFSSGEFRHMLRRHHMLGGRRPSAINLRDQASRLI